MPHDALEILTHLRQQLGREPSLVDMLAFAGADPAGMQADPPVPVPPSQLPREHGDGYLTARLQAEELLAGNPELLRVREQLVRMMLFGLDQQGGLLQGPGRLGGYLSPPTSPTPGPNVKRGIGGGGWSIGSDPAGGI